MEANAVPDDRRVYTDDRFPALEIHNFGSPMFVIFEKDEATGRFHEIGSFVAYEKAGVDLVTEPFAQRRAKVYFEHMAKTHSGPEAMDEPEGEAVPIKSANRFNWQPGGQATAQAKAQGVNPLAGMREMTQQDVDDVLALARNEADPQKRQALLRQATSMMAQQESAAQRVVRILLSL